MSLTRRGGVESEGEVVEEEDRVGLRQLALGHQLTQPHCCSHVELEEEEGGT